MATRKETLNTPAPDLIPLTKLQAERLAALTGVSVKELVGGRPVELAERFKWTIDARFWRYRRVCGRVVKRDPVTGVEYPVPNATVHVEDTDCSLLFYSPPGSKFSWFYPFLCRREEITTVTTDSCGRFCVWIPRWEIDWIRTWRAQRVCFPIIFQRPNWRDIVAEQPFEPPIPLDDPSPLQLDRLRLSTGGSGAGAIGNPAAQRLARSVSQRTFGASTEGLEEALGGDVFEDNLQPPLPEELVNFVADTQDGERRAKGKEGEAGDEGETHELIRASLAQRAGIDPSLFSKLDLRRVIGPFKRCFTVFVPVWTPIFDIPDITFRVTQDVNGDGVEETIYSEGYFQVRWDAATIPDVTLRASSWARESRVCDAPDPIPCGNVPAINFAGLMPVTAAYHNNTTGHAIKPNRPKTSLGVSFSPATAPYCLNVNLFGCLPSVAGAAKYRLVYRYATDASAPFTPPPPADPLPFTDLPPWYWHPIGGPPVPSTPEAGTGWYALPPGGLAGTPEESFLFPFDTTRYVPGLYELAVQIGDSAGTVLATSANVRLMCDNRAPTILRGVEWSRDNGATWTVLPDDCPVVRRLVAPVDVIFKVTWTVMAPAHYRDSKADSAGCGISGPAPQLILTTPPQIFEDWHTGPSDNAFTYVLTYRLPSTHAEGTYSFGCHANSRAFNPSGYIAEYQANDWLSDAGAPLHSDHRVYFSVINAA